MSATSGLPPRPSAAALEHLGLEEGEHEGQPCLVLGQAHLRSGSRAFTNWPPGAPPQLLGRPQAEQAIISFSPWDAIVLFEHGLEGVLAVAPGPGLDFWDGRWAGSLQGRRVCLLLEATEPEELVSRWPQRLLAGLKAAGIETRLLYFRGVTRLLEKKGPEAVLGLIGRARSYRGDQDALMHFLELCGGILDGQRSLRLLHLLEGWLDKLDLSGVTELEAELLAATFQRRFDLPPKLILNRLRAASRPAAAVNLDKTREKRAKAFLRKPDLVPRLLDIAGHRIAGERENVLLAILTIVGRWMRPPLWLCLVGEPGSGKSHCLKTALDLFCPEEYLVEVSRLTENSLFYLNPHELQGKVLYLHQFEGMQGASYSFLVSHTECKLVLYSAQRAARREVLGPFGLLTSRVREAVEAQIDSRLTIRAADGSAEQTEAVLSKTVELTCRPGHSRAERQEYAFLKDCFRLLQPKLPVCLPFADRLVRAFPKDSVQSRRLFSQRIALIKAHALLNQFQRRKNSHGELLAEERDCQGEALFLGARHDD